MMLQFHLIVTIPKHKSIEFTCANGNPFDNRTSQHQPLPSAGAHGGGGRGACVCREYNTDVPQRWINFLSVHDEFDEVFVGDVSVCVLEWSDEELDVLLLHGVTEVVHDLSEFTAEHHLVAFTIEALEHFHKIGVVGDGGSFLELLVDGDEGGEVDARLVELRVLQHFLHISGKGVEGEGLQ